MLLLSASCSPGESAAAGVAVERDSLPVLETFDVSTVVSDSGVVKYRIEAPLWLVYDKKRPSYWAFEQGVYLENFDEEYRVQADIKADTAYYYDLKKLWELRGHVEIKNVMGERFSTDLLFWDQNAQKVYSDRYIRIEQTERTITGHGFESNQQFTTYTINRPTGIFYVKDKEQPAAGDSLAGLSENSRQP